MRQNPASLRRFLLEEWIAQRIASPPDIAAAPPECRAAAATIAFT
jgi:hypothetical protein